ncbi:MAG: type I-U CRISPR-associated RAMP protein Csb1/Cas7u [Pirellulaceae bacterium]|nr:type I-U CRISPR-associated protein Cas7 [Planctomycetales bacterium]
MTLNYEQLSNAARTGAAFRCRVKLQPAGGKGDKVFPPTYAGAVYATEKRRADGYPEPVDCVLLDSVQSQANRMEEALQQAVDAGRLKLPLIEVDFTDYFPGEDKSEEMRLIDPVGKVTSLQVPHRIADAILRDSIVKEDGKAFRSTKEKDESSYGQRLRRVSNHDATVLFELCPTALIFGMWDSTGPKGGLGAKFERAVVSEIVGVNATTGVRSSSRIDPLGIQLDAGPLYLKADGGWTRNEQEAKQDDKDKPILLGKDGKPSEANHGNVKPDLKDKSGNPYHGGVTVEKAEQTIVISLAALRRLRFPVDGKQNLDADQAGRTVLAALAICAAALADESGLDLRSRCLLFPEENMTWELLDRNNKEDFTITAADAITLLNTAVEAAKKAGLNWREKPLELRPSDELVKLVARSQQLAVQKGGE